MKLSITKYIYFIRKPVKHNKIYLAIILHKYLLNHKVQTLNENNNKDNKLLNKLCKIYKFNQIQVATLQVEALDLHLRH